MAGEWLKFDASTPEKQEVFSITVALGWDDPDLTVGKLLKVWRWFDQQTIDGNAPSVTLALLDRIIGVTGFAQAMCNVGWLCLDEQGVRLPNFDRHNGQTAKNRALTAKRVANHKANAGGNDKGNADSVSAGVTDPLPKEEKRREEKNKEEKPKTKAPPAGDADLFPGVDQQVVADFKALRKQKKATITPTAMDDIVKEAAKANMTLDAALRVCCSRGWAGFKADWVQRDGSPARRQNDRPSINDFGTQGDDADDPFNQLRRA